MYGVQKPKRRATCRFFFLKRGLNFEFQLIVGGLSCEKLVRNSTQSSSSFSFEKQIQFLSAKRISVIVCSDLSTVLSLYSMHVQLFANSWIASQKVIFLVHGPLVVSWNSLHISLSNASLLLAFCKLADVDGAHVHRLACPVHVVHY